MFFILGYSVYSQNAITGNLKDTNYNPISFASVTLTEHNKSEIIAFCSTDIRGNYTLKFSKIGIYDISFAALAYKKEQITIEITTNETKTIKDIFLKNESYVLNEVIISKKATLIKNDTITFQANSFLKGNENSVEDLLKKIPGITVSENGTIKVNNQPIEKILIDDDDLFDKGYKMLSKNLNATAVEKIAIYQNYSNNKLLKNIEDSKKVAINLTLKNKSSKWSGNASLASGIYNKFDSKVNTMKFTKSDKYFILGSANNIGKEITGEIDEIINPSYYDEAGYVGENQNSYSVIDIDGDKPTEINTERSYLNNDKLISSSSITKISKKIKIKSFAFYSSKYDTSSKSLFKKIIINSNNIATNENNLLSKKNSTIFTNSKLIYDISDNKTFENNFEVTTEKSKNYKSLVFNDLVGNEQLNTNYSKINNTFKYTNRYTKEQAFLISGNINFEKKPQIYYVNNSIIGTQNFENSIFYKGIKFDYLRNINDKFLFENTLVFENRKDLLNSNYISNQTNNIILPDKLYNDIEQNFTDIYFTSKLKFKVSDYFSIKPNIEFHSFKNSLFAGNVKDTKKNNYSNFSLTLSYKVANKNRLLFSYSINRKNSLIIDNYEGFILTSFNNFNNGIGQFSQFQNQLFNFRHSIGDFGSKFFSNTSFSFKINKDYFSTNTNFNNNIFSTSKIILNNQNVFLINSNSSYYLKWISSNLKFDFSYYKTNYSTFFNSELSNVNINNLQYGFELRSAFNNFFNYHVGAKFKCNKIYYVANKNQVNSNNTFLNLSFQIGKNINLDFNNDYYAFQNDFFKKSTSYFSDIHLNFKFAQSKTNFKIIYQNIFNAEYYVESGNTETSFFYKQYQLLPKYLIVQIDFKF